MHELEMEQGVTILKLAYVRSPTILAAMVTSSGVAVVQVRGVGCALKKIFWLS